MKKQTPKMGDWGSLLVDEEEDTFSATPAPFSAPLSSSSPSLHDMGAPGSRLIGRGGSRVCVVGPPLYGGGGGGPSRTEVLRQRDGMHFLGSA